MPQLVQTVLVVRWVRHDRWLELPPGISSIREQLFHVPVRNRNIAFLVQVLSWEGYCGQHHDKEASGCDTERLAVPANAVAAALVTSRRWVLVIRV